MPHESHGLSNGCPRLSFAVGRVYGLKQTWQIISISIQLISYIVTIIYVTIIYSFEMIMNTICFQMATRQMKSFIGGKPQTNLG